MVQIHGGSMVAGMASIFDSAILAAIENAVVITI
jgi:hypothetical protein